jgi:hypothetical protein
MESRPSIEYILQLPGVGDAEWIDPPRKAMDAGGRPPYELHPLSMLSVNHLVVFETVEEPGRWWMGAEGKDGVVNAWGIYGTIEDVIEAL